MCPREDIFISGVSGYDAVKKVHGLLNSCISRYDDAQEPPRVQDTQLFRNEYDRQRVLDKQKKLEKKALSRERTKQDKAARKAKK